MAERTLADRVALDIVCTRGCSTRALESPLAAARAIGTVGRCRCGAAAEVQRARFAPAAEATR